MDESTAIDNDAVRKHTAGLAASTTDTTEQVRNVAEKMSGLGVCFETFAQWGEPAWD